MVDLAFTPALVYVAMLFNKEYGNTPYKNIKEVDEDEVRVRETLSILNVPDNHIFYLKDGTWD